MILSGDYTWVEMSSGESFEDAIAFLLSIAGFRILEHRKLVKVGDDVVGDIDVLAYDPLTNAHIAVECKDQQQPASAEQFNDFMKMLDIEGIRHGIFAARRDLAKTVTSLATVERSKGYNLLLVDGTYYDALRKANVEGDRKKIEDDLRDALRLYRTDIASFQPQIKKEKLGLFGRFRKPREEEKGEVECPNCGHLMPRHAKFCAKCGTRM